MALSDRQIVNGIRFGDWLLAPLDEQNWELCHWHVPKAVGRHKGGTEPQWFRLGRYYQRNTFEGALLYAADVELKNRCRDVVVQLEDALREHERILKALMDEFRESMGARP